MSHDFELRGGFHPPEHGDRGPFRWTKGVFQVRLFRGARFARAELCYYGDHGTLSAYRGDALLDQLALCRGWHTYVVRLDAAAADVIDFRVDPVVDVGGDARELGVMLREARLFDDERTFDALRSLQDNVRLNQEEYRQGKAVLHSFPPAIRITVEARCNIPETSQACAYCAWDWAKLAEHDAPAFTLNTLVELGDFYGRAIEVVDCSIGEPTMHKQFGSIVGQIDRDGKQLSMTTNGQMLTARRRREVLGKNLLLYVSIDAATADGYARYRNDRFDDTITNVQALCMEKRDHGDLPRVYVSFIAMRSNVGELSQFFTLMRDVGVDEVKIRSLYLDDNLPAVTTNNGYRFEYADEVLTNDELAAVAERARRLAAEHQVALYIEQEQFAADAGSSGAPICSEPWRTMYVLRRGIMPCCYATEPVARWTDQNGRPLEEFLRDVFNGPAYQEIRSELAAGRLSEYCRNTPSCPILKSKQQQGLVAGPRNAYQRRALGAPPATTVPILPLVPLDVLTAPRQSN